MSKKKRKAAAEKDPGPSNVLDGTVLVTFDAGGKASSVNPNPVVPTPIGDGRYTITWILDQKLNTNPGFEVKIANVVLCDRDDQLKRLRSRPGKDGQSWTWTFKPDFKRQAVPYELFFAYSFGKKSKKGRKSDPSRVASLRQILAVDPTIIPPSEGL